MINFIDMNLTRLKQKVQKVNPECDIYWNSKMVYITYKDRIIVSTNRSKNWYSYDKTLWEMIKQNIPIIERNFKILSFCDNFLTIIKHPYLSLRRYIYKKTGFII